MGGGSGIQELFPLIMIAIFCFVLTITGAIMSSAGFHPEQKKKKNSEKKEDSE